MCVFNSLIALWVDQIAYKPSSVQNRTISLQQAHVKGTAISNKY